jgi:8-oxo-dGTP pyrophosphatase MutT (NUDIX family)
MWETTGGSAVAGEDSLTAALRETREELGIILKPENGQIFKCYTYPHSSGDGAAYFVVWIFQQEVDISTIVLQPKETCDAMWASRKQIKQMINDGSFIGFSYIDELFEQSY